MRFDSLLLEILREIAYQILVSDSGSSYKSACFDPNDLSAWILSLDYNLFGS